MDVLEQLGALHHALQPSSGPSAPADLRGWYAAIRKAIEVDPATDRFDRETLDVIGTKLEAFIGEIESGAAEPDYKPAATWVAALGAAIYRRREAARLAAERQGRVN